MEVLLPTLWDISYVGNQRAGNPPTLAHYTEGHIFGHIHGCHNSYLWTYDLYGFKFFGPKQLLLCTSCFRAQKSIDFHGPTLPMALSMDLPASKELHTGPYQSEVHR